MEVAPVGRNGQQRGAGAFTFIDLFAGIGGLRMGFEQIGGRCIFTSEVDEFAKRTYLENFPSTEGHILEGDITEVPTADIPDHDLLLAGFPCQPFSIAGVSKKNSLGRAHGFDDAAQGTLFFEIVRIIAEKTESGQKRPKMLLLENVRNLESHDGGRTFDTIRDELEKLGYHVTHKVMDASAWVPQRRKRILIACFDRNLGDCPDFDFNQVPAKGPRPTMRSILLPHRDIDPKYTLSDKLWEYLQQYAIKHQRAGNGFGFGKVGPNDVARTLSARYYKDGAEILVDQGADRNPRRLTPRECARLMGFPDGFEIPVSDTQAYKQFGNSVVVPMIAAVAEALRPYLLTDSWESLPMAS